MMINDMMPTIEEFITPNVEAEIEHREWLAESAMNISRAIGAPCTIEDVQAYDDDMAQIDEEENCK